MEQNAIASLTLQRISKRPPRVYHILGVFGQKKTQLNISLMQCIPNKTTRKIDHTLQRWLPWTP